MTGGAHRGGLNSARLWALRRRVAGCPPVPPSRLRPVGGDHAPILHPPIPQPLADPLTILFAGNYRPLAHACIEEIMGPNPLPIHPGSHAKLHVVKTYPGGFKPEVQHS